MNINNIKALRETERGSDSVFHQPPLSLSKVKLFNLAMRLNAYDLIGVSSSLLHEFINIHGGLGYRIASYHNGCYCAYNIYQCSDNTCIIVGAYVL